MVRFEVTKMKSIYDYQIMINIYYMHILHGFSQFIYVKANKYMPLYMIADFHVI